NRSFAYKEIGVVIAGRVAAIDTREGENALIDKQKELRLDIVSTVKTEFEPVAALDPAQRILDLVVLRNPGLGTLYRIPYVESAFVERDARGPRKSRIGHEVGCEPDLSRGRAIERRN